MAELYCFPVQCLEECWHDNFKTRLMFCLRHQSSACMISSYIYMHYACIAACQKQPSTVKDNHMRAGGICIYIQQYSAPLISELCSLHQTNFPIRVCVCKISGPVCPQGRPRNSLCVQTSFRERRVRESNFPNHLRCFFRSVKVPALCASVQRLQY